MVRGYYLGSIELTVRYEGVGSTKQGSCADSCYEPVFGFSSDFVSCKNANSLNSFFQEQYIFIHQCVQLMWQKKKQQFCISDVIYENVSKS